MSAPPLVLAAAQGALIDASDLVPAAGREPVPHWTEQLAERVVDAILPALANDLRTKVLESLHSCEDDRCLDGPLGEAIGCVAGSASLEFVTPEELAEGIGNWLVSELGGTDAA